MNFYIGTLDINYDEKYKAFLLCIDLKDKGFNDQKLILEDFKGLRVGSLLKFQYSTFRVTRITRADSTIGIYFTIIDDLVSLCRGELKAWSIYLCNSKTPNTSGIFRKIETYRTAGFSN